MLEREHVVARTPIESREQQAQRGGRIWNERDVLRRAVDEPADLGANAIGIVIPGEEIRAGQFIAMSEVPGDGVGGAPGQLAEGRGVEIRPVGERGELAADGVPIRMARSAFLNHHFGGLDDDFDGVALLQPQFFGAGAGDNAFDQIVADLDDDVRHDGADLYAFHDAGKLISR